MVSARGVLLGALWLAASAHADVGYEGEARDVRSGALLYREQHLLRADGVAPRERLVLYRCADGAAFARKRVDYAAGAAVPTFALEDARFGYREGVRQAQSAREAYVRRDAAGDEQRATLAPTPNLVIDAGFDEFVRAHWEALQRGDTVSLDFLVPSRLTSYGFKLRLIDRETVDGEAASVFRLSLSGLLGWFADDIEVSYRDADRRLLRFEGLTNIRADREDNLVARIDFPPQRHRSDVEPAEWQRVLDEPLTNCTPGGS